jgi:hypothetical protein
MHELHDHSAFTDAGRYALHRTVPYVSDHEDTRHIRFEQARIAVEGPALRPLPIR